MSRADYLNDTAFLYKLDAHRNKIINARLTILTKEEEPYRVITGRVLPGSSINIDGKSAVRRTSSLKMIVDEEVNDLYDLDNLISINKKVKLEIGYTNNFINDYDNDIFWFKQGIFVIQEPHLSHSTTSTELSLTLQDKIAITGVQKLSNGQEVKATEAF